MLRLIELFSTLVRSYQPCIFKRLTIGNCLSRDEMTITVIQKTALTTQMSEVTITDTYKQCHTFLQSCTCHRKET